MIDLHQGLKVHFHHLHSDCHDAPLQFESELESVGVAIVGFEDARTQEASTAVIRAVKPKPEGKEAGENDRYMSE